MLLDIHRAAFKHQAPKSHPWPIIMKGQRSMAQPIYSRARHASDARPDPVIQERTKGRIPKGVFLTVDASSPWWTDRFGLWGRRAQASRSLEVHCVIPLPDIVDKEA